jgi:hypothetical protein
VCDFCGTHCFCDAENGLLPRKRRAVVNAAGVAAPSAVDAAAVAVVDNAADAAPAVVDAGADAAAVVVDHAEFEGILALSAYDE